MNQLDGVIDVKDLFAELIRKLWLIVLCAVLSAVILGGYAYVQNKQSAQTAEKIENILGEEELEAADLYVEKVVQFLNMEDYMETSIITNCDPYNVYQTQIQYVISGDVDTSEVATIRTCYENYVADGHLSNAIAEMNDAYAGKVLLDAITIDSATFVQSDSLKLVSVQLTAIDEAQTEELVAYVKELLEDYSVVVSKEIGEHKLVFLNQATITDLDYEFVKLRGNLTSLYEFLEEELGTYATALSSEQMRYAVEVLKASVDEETLADLGIEVGSESGKTTSVKKFVVLGAGVGFAGAVVLIIALYFFTSHLKSEKEIEHLYGIKHYGNCPVYKSNVFDRLADKLFYKDKSYDVAMAKASLVKALLAMCKEEQIKELGIVGDVDAVVAGELEDVCKNMKTEGVEITLLRTVSEENPTLPGNVIIVELVKKTMMNEIAKVIKECNEKEIALRGYITFSK